MKKGYIVLENGKIFEGERFGYEGEAIGELVFTTSVVGYIETLTDACYQGQILLQTFPLIGNYGWIESDTNGKDMKLAAYIVREWCETPSNFRCEGTIDAELAKRKIPGLFGVDTRELTRIIRENGTMNAMICDDPSKVDFEALKAYKADTSLASSGISPENKVYECNDEKYKVTVVNYGEYLSLIDSLVSRGCTVTVVPYTASSNDILSTNPDGIVLSNGAGNPKDNVPCIKVISELLGQKPIFGVSLGHQLLALAKGCDTYKLKYGHRGGSQPVKDLNNGKTYVTEQNHGYAVESDSAAKCGAKITYVNGNDQTCEGLEYPQDNAFSVQFIPIKSFGKDHTEAVLFDKFVSLLK